MIDEALATRIPKAWHPPAHLVERVRMLERGLLIASIKDANANLARAQAEQAHLYALAARTAVAEDEREGTLEKEWALRSWKAEIAALTNTSRQAVAGLMGRSAVLVEDFPLVQEALAAGDVSMAHARVICDAGTIIVHDDPVEQAARRDLLVRVALEKAREASPGRLRDFAVKQAEKLTGSSLDERYEHAMQSRAVHVVSEGDGMGSLGARHSLPVLSAIDGRLSEIAKAVISARADDSDDTRSLHQVRADVFADLLLTGVPGSCPEAAGITAKAAIVIPALTMLADRDPGTGFGLTDNMPALLDGVTPIPMSVARALAATAPTFERILTHPITGTVVEVDRYRPTEGMRAWLRARDVHCRFPGCRLPAEKCDLDHTIPASEGGPTSLTNLAAFCRWDHTVKGNTAWRTKQLEGGVLHWTSPSGSILTGSPEPRGVQFEPSPPGEPGLPINGTNYRVRPVRAQGGNGSDGEDTRETRETQEAQETQELQETQETGEQRLARLIADRAARYRAKRDRENGERENGAMPLQDPARQSSEVPGSETRQDPGQDPGSDPGLDPPPF